MCSERPYVPFCELDKVRLQTAVRQAEEHFATLGREVNIGADPYPQAYLVYVQQEGIGLRGITVKSTARGLFHVEGTEVDVSVPGALTAALVQAAMALT